MSDYHFMVIGEAFETIMIFIQIFGVAESSERDEGGTLEGREAPELCGGLSVVR